MRLNRHDTWIQFSEKYRDLLAGTGLPAAVIRSEQHIRELLEMGRATVSETQFSLEELATTNWSALYEFATVFFREFESYAPEDLFPAFRCEALRRGDKFPT
ncbi:MAG TPA: hypothetical protein VG122_08235 [Gemmata sp.]|jgi:hypothetical protein|nr:hypothetical protein [Gemmata sp.]